VAQGVGSEFKLHTTKNNYYYYKKLEKGKSPTPAVPSPLPGCRYSLLTGAQPEVWHSCLWGLCPSPGDLLPVRERWGREAPDKPGRAREGHVAPTALT
jgi:hypothetical protein